MAIAGIACLSACYADKGVRTVAFLLALLASETTWQRESNAFYREGVWANHRGVSHPF